MSNNKSYKGYTGPQTSKRTADYFESANARFEAVNKASIDCKIHANEAIKYAINVLENGVSAMCSVQDLVSGTGNTTFAQTAAAGLAALSYWNPSAYVGAFAVGTICATAAVLYSPTESIECLKSTATSGVIGAYIATETLKGLTEGVLGVASYLVDNTYGCDITELAGAVINTNMIEYS